MADQQLTEKETSSVVAADAPAPQLIVTIEPAEPGMVGPDGLPIETTRFQCATVMAGLIKHQKTVPLHEEIQVVLYAHGIEGTRTSALAAIIAAECIRSATDESNIFDRLRAVMEVTADLILSGASSEPTDPPRFSPPIH